MFRQETPDNYNQVTVRRAGPYSIQTGVPARKEKIKRDYRPYGQLLDYPLEYRKQWDWFSLLAFISPFLLMIIPASISSTGLVLYVTFFRFYNFYVYLFLLYSCFLIVYVSGFLLF